jgi:mannose-1-phosphate guanylyltransferase
MKAFLLAGGRGERLQPLTLSMPKCLVPVCGDPLLGVWLEHLSRYGVDEVLVNVSMFPEQVERFVAGRLGGPRVTVVREDAPIGNAGTVRANRSFVENERDFWIIYSDNLTNVDLSGLRRFHDGHDGAMTMGLFEAPDPRQAGIVSVDRDGRILGFEEKPLNPASTLANAGIYLGRHALLDAIPAFGPVVDFGLDVFPRLTGQLYGWRLDGVLIDIGTPAGLDRASRAWAGRSVAGRLAEVACNGD